MREAARHALRWLMSEWQKRTPSRTEPHPEPPKFAITLRRPTLTSGAPTDEH